MEETATKLDVIQNPKHQLCTAEKQMYIIWFYELLIQTKLLWKLLRAINTFAYSNCKFIAIKISSAFFCKQNRWTKKSKFWFLLLILAAKIHSETLSYCFEFFLRNACQNLRKISHFPHDRHVVSMASNIFVTCSLMAFPLLIYPPA